MRALRAEGLEVVLWQTKPVPGQRLFRDRVGYGGRPHPWDPAHPVDYDIGQYPETCRLLDGSLLLFSQSCPIFPQTDEVDRRLCGRVRAGLDAACRGARSRPSMSPGRKRLLQLAFAVVGGSVVAYLVVRSGPAAMAAALVHVGPWLPVLVLLEVGIVVLNAAALRSLYRGGGAPPLGALLWRVSFQAQLLAVVAPAGRLVAETFRAHQLAGRAGRARAAAAAAWMMALVLIANATVAVPTAVAVASIDGATWPTFAVSIYCAVTFAIGCTLILAGRARLGRWLARRIKIAREAGPAFDTAFKGEAPGVAKALLFECGTRLLLISEILLLRHAVGASADVVSGLATAGVLLTGAAAGDFVPAQLGATDGPVSLAAGSLGMRGSQALALTLGLHAVQLIVGLAGALLGPLIFRARRPAPAESS